MSRPIKRSLTLHGHRTSVSLEEEFWREFRRMATERSLPLNILAADIDAARDGETGLATAIRLFVLRELQARRDGRTPPKSGS
ncbi:MAG: ribbon-helix-helix domain-containing protein [Rhodobacteraceae bacterium]|nr:ribbon-helix-helix domain-containing protein [Paracoccaceae bacterium]